MSGIVESPEVIARNIVEWKIPIPNKKYKVVIHCSTYNHEKYIEDALNGFVMQKTNFSFCAIIIDDCSTDGTADIVRKYATKYPGIIKPICLGYNHMQHGLSRTPYFDNWHKSAEYLAQCEGDDYWIDPLKLQKQVEYLDKHEECGLCYGYARTRYETNIETGPGSHYCETDFSQLLISGYIPTCTLLFRCKIYEDYIKRVNPLKMNWKQGDLPLYFWFACHSVIYCFHSEFAVYRIAKNSLSHTSNLQKYLELRESEYRVRLFYDREFNESLMKEEIEDWYNRNMVVDNIYKLRNYSSAVSYFFKLHKKKIGDFVILVKGIYSILKYKIKY